MFNHNDTLEITLLITQVKLITTPPVFRELPKRDRALRLQLIGLESIHTHQYVVTDDYVIVQQEDGNRQLKLSRHFNSMELFIPGMKQEQFAFMPILLNMQNTQEEFNRSIVLDNVSHIRILSTNSIWEPFMAEIIKTTSRAVWYSYPNALSTQHINIRVKQHNSHHAVCYVMSLMTLEVMTTDCPISKEEASEKLMTLSSRTWRRYCTFSHPSIRIDGERAEVLLLFRSFPMGSTPEQQTFLIHLNGYVFVIQETKKTCRIWCTEPGVLTYGVKPTKTSNQVLIDV